MIRSCTWIHTIALTTLVAGATACQERSAGAGGGSWGDSRSQPDAALQSFVDSDGLVTAAGHAQTRAPERKRLVEQIRRLYREQNYQFIWIDGDHPSDRYRQLAKLLDTAEAHGLPGGLYGTPLDDFQRETKVAPGQAPELDVRVTATALQFLTHLSGGRIDPRQMQTLWTLTPEKPDVVPALSSAIRDNDLPGATERLQPQQPGYRELQHALVRYRAIAAKGGWPSIPARTGLKPNQQSAAVPVLRRRLAIEGDLDAAHENDLRPVFDATVVEAVKRFQERHRLEPDGIVDAETVRALNVPVVARIRAIELNLERWRWMPDPMPARYLLVNVPDFRLEAIENGKPVFGMRVVVGGPDNKTPIFADQMTHVVFSPYWNVPPRIATEETIPRAETDPGFLARNNMEVVSSTGEVVEPDSVDWSSATGFRIRQRPGSGNALGGVKFIFPNNFDVYLHDTNATKLFDRIERGLSHGCVRVEEPHKLAQYVLRDQPEWTPEAIAAAMTSGQEKHVKVSAPIPVFILYKTAWVHDGGVRFLKDLYGHDAAQAAKLFPSGAGETNDGLETRR